MFWYLLPFVAIAFVLALFIKQIPLADVSGMVARGEAVAGEDAERMEAEQRSGAAAPAAGGRADAGPRS